MPKMSPQLILSAAASTMAMAALALGSPAADHHVEGGAGMIPTFAELPAPPLALPALGPR